MANDFQNDDENGFNFLNHLYNGGVKYLAVKLVMISNLIA